MLRPARHFGLIVLAGLLVMAGCAGEAEQRRTRAPLREVFPPPSLQAPAAQAQQPAAEPEPPGPAAPAGGEPEAPADEDEGSAADPEQGAGLAERRQAGVGLRAPSVQADPSSELFADDDGGGAQPSPSVEPAEAATSEPTAAASRSVPPEPGAAAAEDERAPAQRAPSRAAAVPGEPAAPRVIVSTRPTLLVAIDGSPAYGPVTGTKLQRVLNTPAFLVKGGSGYYYLSVYDGFMRATRLNGPWNVLPQPPRVVVEAKAAALAEGEADLLAGRSDPATGRRPSLKTEVPQVIVSTRPAALIVTRGEPAYEPVDGTDVSRVTNTDARVFVYRPQDMSYLQLGTRWLRAARLEGPWQAVADGEVPQDVKAAAGG
jgi:hypothetical protein